MNQKYYEKQARTNSPGLLTFCLVKKIAFQENVFIL